MVCGSKGKEAVAIAGLVGGIQIRQCNLNVMALTL